MVSDSICILFDQELPIDTINNEGEGDLVKLDKDAVNNQDNKDMDTIDLSAISNK